MINNSFYIFLDILIVFLIYYYSVLNPLFKGKTKDSWYILINSFLAIIVLFTMLVFTKKYNTPFSYALWAVINETINKF